MSKEVIRRGIFETNSSSVHSITMCTDDKYTKWENGEVYFDKDNKEFVESNEDIKKARQCDSWDEAYELQDKFPDNEWLEYCYHRYLTCDEFNDWDYIEYETFHDWFTTQNGETVHAFGYYGHD